MSLTKKIRGFYIRCQQELFPWLERQFGSLPKRYQKLVMVLEMARVDDHLPRPLPGRYGGRPEAHRANLARSFLAKMVLNLQTTSALRERLLIDSILRSICGWPSESTFSRAFAKSQLPNRIHEALIAEGYVGAWVGPISRNPTAMEAREKPVPKKEAPAPKPRGRPKQGEARPKELHRMEKQRWT